MLTTIRRKLIKSAPLMALALMTGACDSDETGPAEDHTPTSFKILIGGVEAAEPYVLPAGTTVRVQIKFYNAANEDLDEVEGSHFGGLFFTPAALATVAPVADHHFQFDVTGGAPGTGTLTIGFGHDAAADEHQFPSVAVSVQ